MKPQRDSQNLTPAPDPGRPVRDRAEDVDGWVTVAARVAGLLPPPAPDPARFLTALHQGLTISNLTASRRRGRPELDLLALRVPPGKLHAVVGPAGAGTTLLLDLVHGTRQPTAGQIWWAGQDITNQPVTRRAGWLGRTHHALSLVLSLTCLDNILLGEQDPTTGQLAYGSRLLDQIGLTAHADEPAGRLKPGQQRLLDIAVAVAGRPDLLLLDDPAAGLTDPDLRYLEALLRGLPAGTTVLLTGHDTRLLDAVDWITILNDGRKQISGTPADIRATPAIHRLIHPDPSRDSRALGPVPSSAALKRDITSTTPNPAAAAPTHHAPSDPLHRSDFPRCLPASRPPTQATGNRQPT